MDTNNDFVRPASICSMATVSVDEAPRSSLDPRTFILMLGATLSLTARDHELGMPDLDPVIEMDSIRTALSEGDQLLEQTRSAVVAGEIKPTQNSIRKFLRCRQTKPGNRNRQYVARFSAAHD